ARRALAMHAEAATTAVHHVFLDLRHVVADVVHEPEAQRRGAETEGRAEGPLHQAHHHLPVRPGEVRRRGHRAEVRLAFGRTERDAGELTVRDADAVALHGTSHGAERVVAHLVAEAARAG